MNGMQYQRRRFIQRGHRAVAEENPGKPLSDNDIADIFKKDDIRLARRTVAKYREQLGILPSKLRRKAKF